MIELGQKFEQRINGQFRRINNLVEGTHLENEAKTADGGFTNAFQKQELMVLLGKKCNVADFEMMLR